jgi:beta-N-acetylhexosaminidase
MSSIETHVENCLEKMDLHAKIGQCLTYWWRGAMITPAVIETITTLHCGGLRVEPYRTESGVEGYYGLDLEEKNFQPPQDYFTIAQSSFQRSLPGTNISASEYARRLNRLKEIAMNRPHGAPLHICTDFEGDMSHDFPFDGMNIFPANMGLCAAGTPENAYRAGYVIARQLGAMGIQMVHSPVCDVNLNPRNPEINIRAFSDSPETCSSYAAQMSKGIMDGGIIPTAKHFPGRGDSGVDAHKGLPTLDVPRSRLDAVELLPYIEQIAQQVPAIMTAHNAYPALDDSGLPATLSSKILIDLLRNEMGFRGVITSDAMGMGAIVKKWGVPVASAMALKAGCDLVLLKFEDELRTQTFFEIKRWVDDGRISREELDTRVRNVLRMKAEHGLFDNGGIVDADAASGVLHDEENVRTVRDISRRAVTVIRDPHGLIPLSPYKKVMVIEQLLQDKTVPRDTHFHQHSFNEAMLAHSLSCIPADTSFSATDKEIEVIMQRVAQADIVVMTNHFWRVHKENNTRLVSLLTQKNIPVIVVTNTPYPSGVADEADAVICTFGVTARSMQAAADLLYGSFAPTGRLPVSRRE